MIKDEIRSIKNCNGWDWAYVCIKNKGKCLSCPAFHKNTCSFAAFSGENEFGKIMIHTKTFFLEEQKDMLAYYFGKIVEEKERRLNENNNKR